MLWVRAGARQHAGGVNIETPAAVAQWFGEGVLPDAVMRTKRDALWSMPCCTLMQFPETSFLPCVTPSSPTPGQGGSHPYLLISIAHSDDPERRCSQRGPERVSWFSRYAWFVSTPD